MQPPIVTARLESTMQPPFVYTVYIHFAYKFVVIYKMMSSVCTK